MRAQWRLKRRARPVAIVLAFALALGACTGEAERTSTPAPTDIGSETSPDNLSETPGSPVPAPTPGTDDESGANRRIPMERGAPAESLLGAILVNGDLVVIDPDGENQVLIASSADAVVSQPAFSPDGTRLAWSELRPLGAGGDQFDTYLVTANVDGSDPIDTRTPFLSFYSSWDPTSARVAFIGNAGPSVGMGLAEVGRGAARGELVSTGIPYYLSWNPTGQVMLARVANELQLIGFTGIVDPLFSVTANFRVPIWAGDSLFFPQWRGEHQELIRLDLETDERQVIARYDGELVFIVDPTSRLLALQTMPLDPETDLASVARINNPELSGAIQVGADDVPLLEPGLDVLDLETGVLSRISDDPAVAFYFSPDGQQLLVLAVDENLADDDAPVDEIVRAGSWLRWDRWSDGAVLPLARFKPSPVSIQYLLFFEQYAQSHTFWAPDSSSFVYAGMDENGDDGIWVQAVDGELDPVLISNGTFAVWSPT